MDFNKAITDNVNINKSYSIDDIVIDEIVTEEEEPRLSILLQDKEEEELQDNINNTIENIKEEEVAVDHIPVNTDSDNIPDKKEESKKQVVSTKPARKKGQMIM